MDKILISALFALLAGFLTTAISFVKLVNDKEGRVSDFRQQWAISVRESLANLLSKVTSLCQLLEERAYRAKKCTEYQTLIVNAKLDSEKELLKISMEYDLSMLEKANEGKSALFKEIYSANHLFRLHIKQNDPDFISIESKIDLILGMLRNTEDAQNIFVEQNLKGITGRIDVLCSEILGLSRLALKCEWEKVKKGEKVYIKTKMIAKWGSVFFFFIFLTIGIHWYVASHKMNSIATSAVSSTQSLTPSNGEKTP